MGMNDARFFLNGKVTLWHGDSREVLTGYEANSFDSVVTDPPYALVSIVKRFGKEGSAPPRAGRDAPLGSSKAVYVRSAAGFMGKQWDTGETAFVPAFWAEVLRVLKPGGHVLAFSGTRTYHRLACAIEDAGFEIRDMTAWLYGSGFPKSHDVSKGLDKTAGHWRGRAGAVTIESQVAKGTEYERTDKGDPITDDAVKWQGWGTALKPALEPIVLARKPLTGTVAANVLKFGTGALNIDGCRVTTWESDQHLCASCAALAASKPKLETPATRECSAIGGAGQMPTERVKTDPADTSTTDIGFSDGKRTGSIDTNLSTATYGNRPMGQSQPGTKSTTSTKTEPITDSKICSCCRQQIIGSSTRQSTAQGKNGLPQVEKPPASIAPVKGRWPANCIHDGSEEVLAGFPDVHGAGAAREEPGGGEFEGGNGWGNMGIGQKGFRIGDSGSAARFFKECNFTEDEWNANNGHNANVAESPSPLCETPIAASPVSPKTKNGKSQAILDSTEDCSGCTQTRSPANADSLESTDTIRTTASHMTSSGFAPRATGDTINPASEERAAGVNVQVTGTRFWYSSKADSDDRIGSKHPTVKPVDLMRYLCRLITPPGGMVLDPLAGSGSTGEAAFYEGFRCTLIEREAEYITDIERRMALCLAGPEEKARIIIKAKGLTESPGPLFEEAAE